ncbi:sensor histidine kinase KdpD [Deinococcus soli (ex Cha et al. 2016)]|uniref:Two-component system sensor histidine kinase KdpD n=2 Tax=Deinococcus soli (ex Cha et al. 2016) TaxID=1309411 RepID=A0ACC6KKG5_9DEIO|nr:sensor histidine kinase KdpD [Deinococcus soli (ex Cha et al. 2016)]MDR6220289.1 two-component system sensor histidine kinase KdpD [Deinococcus soli (ex Cha et al. 2016)]MDR6330144.1 two-component system sensor histidine kinase KdpD [Deinococcus soli (ex Cha et al. 2016)]MDR6752903.1 two-component system sensor histidine kinase KdpD [Deinococcus soli (ex Cha et al. 2016)]
MPGAARPGRGRHRVFVGMAAGVGKTTRALNELRDRLERGEDALIGVLETHGRAFTQAAAAGLPVFPRLEVVRGGVTLGELDVAGLIARRPDVVLVDELAHSNAPGSAREKRWMDVEALLDAGVNVLSTVNVQHLESLHDTVARLTGVRVRERIPDAVLRGADELVLVDLTPADLRERVRSGAVYGAERAEHALTNFFTLPNLTALRELALRQVAHVVEQGAAGLAAGLGVQERVVVAVAAEETGARLIRRGGQLAQRLHADLQVVTVRSGRISAERARLLDTFRAVTVALGGEFIVLDPAGGVAATLIRHVQAAQATQVVLGESSRSRWEEVLRGDIIRSVLRQTRNVDVYVITRE